MSEPEKLHHPWLVAVWPGMGNVALNAGFYLLSKLDMKVIAEFEASELFDVEAVQVVEGIIQPVRRPRNRFFLYRDPRQRHDLVVFIGEAQPPIGKYHYCRQLVSFAKDLGVERVFTFAAMATQMSPGSRSRIFGAATSNEGLGELKRLELEPLESGPIGGLNGVLLAAAAEAGLHGCCMLGEMPHFFAQLPFPQASMAILEVFATIAGVEIDFTELAQVAANMERQFSEFLQKVQQAIAEQRPDDSGETEGFATDFPITDPVHPEDRKKIEDLFDLAAKDRSKAFELKHELDRLGLFKEYEDRFLDLFKTGEA